MKREEAAKKSRVISFCAIIAALGTVIMLTGGLIPVFTYCSPIIASVLLISVLEEYGAREGWMVWAVTSALSLLIGIDKEAAFFYLFLGWYPIAKPFFDKIPSRGFQLPYKGTKIRQCLIFPAHDGTVMVFFVDSKTRGDVIDAVVRRQLPAQHGHAPGVSPVPEIGHSGPLKGGKAALHSASVHPVPMALPGGGEVRPVHHDVSVTLVKSFHARPSLCA